jgi:hypothetical protein
MSRSSFFVIFDLHCGCPAPGVAQPCFIKQGSSSWKAKRLHCGLSLSTNIPNTITKIYPASQPGFVAISTGSPVPVEEPVRRQVDEIFKMIIESK